jgi:hypothetical protein
VENAPGGTKTKKKEKGRGGGEEGGEGKGKGKGKETKAKSKARTRGMKIIAAKKVLQNDPRRHRVLSHFFPRMLLLQSCYFLKAQARQHCEMATHKLV